LEEWLNKRLHHSWVDPRGLDQEEWEWAELNAFHSADVARQLLEDVDMLIAQAEYLRKKERGEVEVDKFKALWEKLKGDKNEG